MEAEATYLCPIRAGSINFEVIEELYWYWDSLKKWNCEVLVVDGSPPEVFEEHKRIWANCRHVKVDPRYKYLNGKVNGILTGVPLAGYQKIILGDDDIRYSEANIYKMFSLLDSYDLVRPQNFFLPNPVWTQLDSARILLNRAFFKEGDFPGTFGFIKEFLLAAGEFDGDVLFDNEELGKHFHNKGANICYATNFFIQRKPSTFSKWLEQRPRQAYEDFIMKKRTAFFLAIIPAHLYLLINGRRKMAGLLTVLISAISIYKASRGRRNGAKFFLSKWTAALAPLWIIERSVGVYLALFWKVTKGGYPFGDKIIRKGTGDAWKHSKKIRFK